MTYSKTTHLADQVPLIALVDGSGPRQLGTEGAKEFSVKLVIGHRLRHFLAG